ncbi:alkaline phosphatase [Bacteroides sp.]
MKRFSLLFVSFLILLLSPVQSKEVKYVFFMIGDGMGVNQVIATERYRGANAGKIGIIPLTMTQFPFFGLSRTYSLSNGITDSAAGGTALSSCQKTVNGVLGMDSTKSIALTSIAEKAKAKGRAVGITTSVSIDHATPGAFYAHVPDRKMYYTIGLQMAASQFDFFAGADFLTPTDRNKQAVHLHQILRNSGYTILKGYSEYLKEGQKHEKLFLTQLDGKGQNQLTRGRASIPFAIDRAEDDLTLSQITASAINFLEAKNKGFFLMVEGGKIDWACHSNDARTIFAEVEDFDNSIRLAYEFYLKHPDETLIVVTADHETGGLGLGTEGYTLHFDRIASQKCSLPALSEEINKLLDGANLLSWEQLKAVLREKLGFWDSIKLSEEQEEKLRYAYTQTVDGKAQVVKSEYFEEELIAVTAIKILNDNAHSGWTTGAHSGTPVPVFAIGVGAEQFTGIMENTEIPRRIAEIANY